MGSSSKWMESVEKEPTAPLTAILRRTRRIGFKDDVKIE